MFPNLLENQISVVENTMESETIIVNEMCISFIMMPTIFGVAVAMHIEEVQNVLEIHNDFIEHITMFSETLLIPKI